MIKTISIALAIIMFFLMGSYSNIAEAFPEQNLSTLDNGKHSSNQFLSILNVIKNHKPEYTLTQIGDIIYTAYLKVKETLPDISVYEVAMDIKELIVGTPDTKDTLEFLTGCYVVAKKMGY